MLRQRSVNRFHLRRLFLSVIAAVLPMLLGLVSSAHAQRDDYSGPPINYLTAEVNDPVTKLARRLETGEADLPHDEKRGYLPAVLKALEIPVSSQMLVFSKTSLQQSRISPQRPRAIYFNDDVYVGYCQDGDVLEIAATDAKQGVTFYTLDQSFDAVPQFIRDQGQCLTCHASSRTQNAPGLLIRSVFANASGMPEYGSGTFTTDHASPLKERWGGWYVTGSHGDMRHMGNAIFNKRDGELDRDAHANLTSLENLVSTAHYLSPHSDIVALMVIEHQTQTHNAIAWANYETRRAIHQSEIMNRALDRPAEHLSASSQRRIERAAERVVEHLLLCDEFPLTSPIKGTSGFAKEFQSRGVRDSLGRSLRDFDLQTRMFRYPCSYMIYSDAFAGLPDNLRRKILILLSDILDGDITGERAEKYSHLSKVDRQNIKQILLATQPEFTALLEEAVNDAVAD